MPVKAEFARALLALDLDAPHRDAIAFATEIAEQLKLSLVGLFALDDTVRELAGYPGARELLPGSSAWRQIDLERIVHEQMLAAESARRLLSELAGTAGVPSTFEIVSGPLSKALASISRASDILVVAEPHRASASMTRSFGLLVDAAIRSTASVLFIPRAARWRKGPVVSLVGAPDDPGIAVASAIAAAARTELILLDATQSMSTLLRAESLIVLTRRGMGEAADAALALAEARSVPVLLLPASARTDEI